MMRSKLTVEVDKSGRIVLPKPLRDELQLEAGITLEIESCGEEIKLRPFRGHAPLRRKQGIWVFRSGEPLTPETVEDTIREIRAARHKRLVSGRE